MSLYNRLGDQWIWGLKYRPKTVNDIILPDRIKDQFNNIISSGNIPNLLLTGPAGCGKCHSGDQEITIYVNKDDAGRFL